MVKQSPSRNHRSKGIKVKHVLQICLLVAICFWLIYQVKRSHEKKKAFDERDAKMSVDTLVSDEVLKFGRKDLHPRLEETTKKKDKLDEEDEDEARGEEEGNKNEDEEQEEDNKDEQKEDEANGGDEIDEDDQDKSQMDVEREEDFLDGEKERDEGDEKEAREKDSEDMEGGQNGNIRSLEDHDHDGGSSRNAHEAREENYRADDASSAVTHETETERGTDNSTENAETNVGEEESNKSINTTGLKVEKGGTGEDGISSNVSGKGDKGSENGSLESEGGSHLNSIMPTEFNKNTEVGNNTTEGSSKTDSLLLQNGTETRPETDEAQNATVKDQSSTNFMVSNNTEIADAGFGESSKSSNTTESVVPEKVKTSNTSIEVDGHSGSLTMGETADTTRNDKSETSNGIDKSWDSSKSGNADVVQDVPIDSSNSSIPLDEKDVRLNGTLPDIRTEGTKNEDAAAQ